jgi:DNA-binding PadR family transcriptional regulator
MKFGTRPRSHIEPAGVEKLLSCSLGEMGEAPAMGKEVKLTKEMVLAALAERALDLYDIADKLGRKMDDQLYRLCMSLRDDGVVDWMYQEDQLCLTPAGRAALEANRE